MIFTNKSIQRANNAQTSEFIQNHKTISNALTTHPSVSVVIPSYRCANTICKVLDALLAQTITIDNIIVVNDASPDDLEKVLEPYRNFITYVKNEHNMGLAYSYNVGLNTAKTDFVLTLHSDCILDNDYIEILLNHLLNNSRIAAATGQYLIDNIDSMAFSDRMFLILNRIPLEKDRLNQSINYINFIEGKADLFRLPLLRQYGYFNTDLVLTAEDQELSIKFRRDGYLLIQDCRCRFQVLFTNTSDSIRKILYKQRTYARGQAYIMLKFGIFALSKSDHNRQVRAWHRLFQLIHGFLTCAVILITPIMHSVLFAYLPLLTMRALYYFKISNGFSLRDKFISTIFGPISDIYYFFGAIEGSIKTILFNKT